MKAIGYIRVSTDGQVEHGLSLEGQEDKIRAYCLLNDFELLDIYCDAGISGRDEVRPEFEKAFSETIKNKYAFIVWNLSRFGRSAAETIRLGEQLGKSGADIVSLSEHIDTTTAAGKMIFRMLAVLNEYYLDNLADNVNMALQYRKKQGLKLGGFIPYGYDADKKGFLSENKIEQEVIERIRDYHSSGKTLREIAYLLDEEGIKTKRGRNWHPQTINNILKYNNHENLCTDSVKEVSGNS